MKRTTFAQGFALGFALVSLAAHADEGVVGERIADGTGYASVVRIEHGAATERGRLLLVFEQDGMAGVPLWESRDEGAHWRFLLNVTDQPHAADQQWQLRWQPQITELPRATADLPAGALLLSANATRNDEHGRVYVEDLQMYVSTDGGKTWHYRSSIVQGGGRPEDKDNRGVWEPNLHLLDDGRLVAYYSSEQHKREGYNQLLAHKVSTDGGRNWGKEVWDVAIPGGVQRPGMATVTRLGDRRYAMTYENIDGPRNGQVFIKFSRDGLDWGDPQRHGEPVMSSSGSWPAACPVVQWFPQGGPEGVLVVSAQRAGGGGDEAGRSLYWNNASGRGPWWEVRAPVRKRSGNIHAGWTQAVLERGDGSFLHVTSSSVAAAPEQASRNEMLFAIAPLRFDRYEAEDAELSGAAVVPDPVASNQRKARLGQGESRLRFLVHATGGVHTLRLRFGDLGLPATPGLVVNGARVPATIGKSEDAEVAMASASLLAGFNTIDVEGGAHVLDIDYLQVDGAATPPSGGKGK